MPRPARPVGGDLRAASTPITGNIARVEITSVCSPDSASPSSRDAKPQPPHKTTVSSANSSQRGMFKKLQVPNSKLSFVFSRAVVDAVRGFGGAGFGRDWRLETGLDDLGLPVAARRLRLDHHFQHMIGVLRRDGRARALLDAFDEVTQAVRPGPFRLGLLETLPAAGVILPDFVAVGVPIIPQHLEGAFGPIKFQPGTAILLDREAGRHDRETTVSEIEQHLRVVVRLDRLGASSNQPFGNGNTRHCGDAARGAEKSG